jgi:uncharacterized membrane protein YfcA
MVRLATAVCWIVSIAAVTWLIRPSDPSEWPGTITAILTAVVVSWIGLRTLQDFVNSLFRPPKR